MTAESCIAWKRTVMFGLVSLGICLMVMSSISLAQESPRGPARPVEEPGPMMGPGGGMGMMMPGGGMMGGMPGMEVGGMQLPPDLYEFAKKELPHLVGVMEDIQRGEPSREKSVRIMEICERINELRRLQKENPKAFELQKHVMTLDRKADLLAREIRKIKDAKEKKEKIESLRKILEESFEWRQKQRQREAEMITAELNRIQELLKKRESKKAEIIQRQLERLTGDETMEW